MSEKIPTWVPELREWENADYDGIKGFPPDWMPQPYKEKFLSERVRLFLLIRGNKVEYKDIKPHFDKMVAEKYYPLACALMKVNSVYDESLLQLTELYKAVILGEEKGLVMLVGEKIARGKKFSSGGSSKKGREYEPKKSIRTICNYIKSSKYEDVLAALHDADLCNSLYESTTNTIGAVFSVYDDEEIIKYFTRRKGPNNQKQITFKSLRNILTTIKK